MESTRMIENVPFCYVADKVEGDKSHPHLFIAINSRYSFNAPSAVGLGKVSDNVMKRKIQLTSTNKKSWIKNNMNYFDIPIVPANREQQLGLDEIRVVTKLETGEEHESIILIADKNDMAVSGSADEILR